MICPSCHYDNSIVTGVKGYCINCGHNVITGEQKPMRAIPGSDLSGTPVELDEAMGELLFTEKSLLGLQKEHKRILLSSIEDVMVYAIAGGGRGGTTVDYYCDVLVGGIWKSITRSKHERDVLRVAAAIGHRLKNQENKPRELINRLSKLHGVSVTSSWEHDFGPEKPLQLTYPIKLITKTATGWVDISDVRGLVVEGIITLRDNDIDSITVLHTSVAHCYFVLGYTVVGKTVESVWTHRKKIFPQVGKLVNIKWKGGPLADHLNSDHALRELLLSHLKNPPACDIYVTTDQSSGNTVIIFGESYPRQWVRLPELLFPSETRIKAVKMIARRVREFSG